MGNNNHFGNATQDTGTHAKTAGVGWSAAFVGCATQQTLGNRLFEIRAKAKEGIGRSLFCYIDGNKVVVLVAFIENHENTPERTGACNRLKR